MSPHTNKSDSGDASRRALIEQDLEAALRSDRDQFKLALQPIVDAGSGAIVSWEVLLRWHHPTLGNIPPAEFIPIAESSGLVERVGDLVLEASVRHLKAVPPSVELVGRDASLSVNVSPLQLTRRGFAAEIGALLDAHGIEHSRLCLEVTEAVFTNAQAVAALGEVRSLGILVAIDAFGIGNSSLSTLPQLPADVVKLDRSFLPDENAVITGGRSFLTAVVALAHTAGLRVAVEGVETQVQLNAVVLAGADGIQGYLLGVPMPAEEVMAVAGKNTEERPWRHRFEEAALFAAGASLAPESPGILERLRGATRASQASNDGVPRLSRLLTPFFTAPEYVQRLRRLHAFHVSIELELARNLGGKSRGDALVDGQALAALAEDLEWFGAAPLEPVRLLRPPTNVSSALGALYVIEVSHLGGRNIGRQLEKSLGVGPGTGGSYFCGLTAEDARRRWRLLQDVLQLEIDGSGAAWEPVTDAALATSDELDRWMRDGDSSGAASAAG